MTRNVSEETLRVVDDIDGVDETDLSRLPDEVHLALGDITAAAREGLWRCR